MWPAWIFISCVVMMRVTTHDGAGIDSHLRVFENMYSKRLRTYKRLGYSLISNMILEKQSANAIYDSWNYSDVFEQDLVEAEKRIIISSPDIIQDKIDRMIYVTIMKWLSRWKMPECRLL